MLPVPCARQLEISMCITGSKHMASVIEVDCDIFFLFFYFFIIVENKMSQFVVSSLFYNTHSLRDFELGEGIINLVYADVSQ